MNHRTRLTRITNDENLAAQEGLSRLKDSRDFTALITVLEQELVAERELYEQQTASEFQRGQVVMLKKVLALMTGESDE
nr:MAG TPA: hypothetical protein [Caudoviricetes sp.]